MGTLAIKIKKQAEKAILQGHPWVFESSIVKISKEGKTGDVAIIFDSRRNQVMAIGLYDANSPIRIRILHVGGPAKLDSSYFKSIFDTAKSRRHTLLSTDTSAYRLIYGENDGLSGLIIDIYNDTAVVKLYSGVWYSHLGTLIDLLVQDHKVNTVVLRLNRLLQTQDSVYKDGDTIYGELQDEEVTFKEHGLFFKANLIKGHKTGYFLDHRHNRLKVRHLSKHKEVLDIFSYAGGFSVNAIAGGAKKVISLDISAQALEIARANVALNFKKAHHVIMVADAFDGMKQLSNENKKFDLIIVDPPSFAKSESQITGAIRSYKKLIRAAVPLLRQKGILLMASCSSRIQAEDYFLLVKEELVLMKKKFVVHQTSTHDADHPEGIPELSYLKSIYLEIE